jgi:hypothetical protein
MNDVTAARETNDAENEDEGSCTEKKISATGRDTLSMAQGHALARNLGKHDFG